MPSSVDYPHSVRTMESILVKGYDDWSAAKAAAKQRNDRAEKLGIKTRYEVTDIPAARGKKE